MDTFDNNFESSSDSNSFLPSFLRAAKIDDLLRIETKKGAKGVMMMHTAQERPSDGSRKDDSRPDRYFLIEPPYKYRRLLSSGSTSKGGAMPTISNFHHISKLHSTAQRKHELCRFQGRQLECKTRQNRPLVLLFLRTNQLPIDKSAPPLYK